MLNLTTAQTAKIELNATIIKIVAKQLHPSPIKVKVTGQTEKVVLKTQKAIVITQVSIWFALEIEWLGEE